MQQIGDVGKSLGAELTGLQPVGRLPSAVMGPCPPVTAHTRWPSATAIRVSIPLTKPLPPISRRWSRPRAIAPPLFPPILVPSRKLDDYLSPSPIRSCELMKITASGYVYDGRTAPQHQQSCAFTTVYLSTDGTLYVAGRWGSTRDSLDGHPCLFASTDAGDRWEMRHDGLGQWHWDGGPGENKSLACTELKPGELTATSLLVDRSNPELPFINPRTQGLLPMRIIHSTSTDGGRTWSASRVMDASPHLAASTCTHAIMQLPGGLLAQPYEHWKEFDDPEPAWPAARLRYSRDGGTTWPEFATVASHPENRLAYWDQRLAIHPDTGQLIAMFWTHDFARGQDIDVHIAWGSADGRDWSEPQGTGLPGQHCQPLALGGARLLAAYTHRRDPPGIRLSLSDDFGRTWDRSRDLMVYDSSAGTESGAGLSRSQKDLWSDMEAWRFGHPRAALLPTGEVFVVYYAGDDQAKSARWARVSLE